MKKISDVVNEVGFEKKDQILDVAERLFSIQGYSGTSIRDLAKEAGINIAMISYYFGSKENLYLAVIERKMVTIRQDIGDAFPNGGGAWDKLNYIIERYVDKMVENRRFMSLVYTEIGTGKIESITNFLTKRLADNQAAFKDIIQQGIDSKEFREVDPQLTIVSIIGPLKLYVSNPEMVKKLLKEASVEGCYSQIHRDRMKAHLKDMMKRFLVP